MTDRMTIVAQASDLAESIAACVVAYPWALTHVTGESRWPNRIAASVVGACRAVSGDGKTPSPLDVIHHLDRTEPPPAGTSWVSVVVGFESTASSHTFLKQNVERLERLLSCIDAARVVEDARAHVHQGDVEEAESALRQASSILAGWAGEQTDVLSAADAMVSIAAEYDGEAPPVEALDTGFRALDDSNGTIFAAGRLIVLAARPGVGKTAFALNVATNVARHSPVLYWCGEMSGGELYRRVIASVARVPLGMVNRGDFSDRDRDKVRVAMGRIADLSLDVNTSAGMSVGKLDAMVRSATLAGRKPKLVVADYLQRMSSDRSRSREEEVGGIARDLKELAKAHNITVLALAQMNREVEKRANARPKLSDLRDSGQIEQEADAILFPDRVTNEDDYGEVTWPVPSRLYIEKFRHGRSGVTLPLEWHGPFQTWGDGR